MRTRPVHRLLLLLLAVATLLPAARGEFPECGAPAAEPCCCAPGDAPPATELSPPPCGCCERPAPSAPARAPLPAPAPDLAAPAAAQPSATVATDDDAPGTRPAAAPARAAGTALLRRHCVNLI